MRRGGQDDAGRRSHPGAEATDAGASPWARAAGGLGPVEDWPDRLRLAFELILASPAPMLLCCGPDLILLHNEAWERLFGQSQAVKLDSSPGTPLGERRPELAAALRTVLADGTSMTLAGVPLPAGDAPGQATVFLSCSPVRAASGAVCAVLGIVTPGSDGPEGVPPAWLAGHQHAGNDLRRAEEALSQSEARYRMLFDSIDQGFCVIEMIFEGGEAVDYRFIEVNASFRQQTGIADPVGRTMREFAPEHEAHWFETYGRVARERRPLRFENAAEKLGHYYEVYAFPVDAPEKQRVGVLFNDISQRRIQHRALEESEHRFRSLVQGIPQLVWRATDDGRWIWASRQWVSHTGLSADESQDRGWLAAVHADDRAETLAAWELAFTRQETFEAHHRLYHAGERRYRWFQTRAARLKGLDGGKIEWLGTSTDVDDLHRLQEHQKVLLAELQHRVRNTLAVIRSIARRTAATSADVETYVRNLEGRIDTFSRVQAAVTRSPGTGVDLRRLVEEELVAVCGEARTSATSGGDSLLLQAKAAETLALVIHELATNAVKHGALSCPEGRLAVRWRLVALPPAQTLFIEWTESGARAKPPPRRRGFGMEIIQKLLAYELDAAVVLEFGADGLRCEIRLPATERLIAGPPGRA